MFDVPVIGFVSAEPVHFLQSFIKCWIHAVDPIFRPEITFQELVLDECPGIKCIVEIDQVNAELLFNAVTVHVEDLKRTVPHIEHRASYGELNLARASE